MPDRVMRLPEVCAASGLAKATIYVLIPRGEFPSQVNLTPGGRAVGWRLSEVEEWIAKRKGKKNG